MGVSMSPSSEGNRKPQHPLKRRLHPLLKFWNKFLKRLNKKAPASLLGVEETRLESKPTFPEPEPEGRAPDSIQEGVIMAGDPAPPRGELPKLYSHLEIVDNRPDSNTPEENIISSISHPLDRLPTEMIQEIFLRCLPAQNFIKPSPSCAPILLTQINTSWRTIALSDSGLWTSLELTDGREPRIESTIFLAEMWLSRAGKAPLDISMRECRWSQEAVITVLNRFSDQWRHVRLEISELDPLLPISEGPTPNLETFELRTLDIPTRQRVNSISSMLERAPRLRQLLWDNLDRESYPLTSNWSQLTRLTLITHISIKQCFTILENSQLSYVALQSVLLPSKLPKIHTPILVPHLRSFVISTNQDVTPLLNALTVPELCEVIFNMRSDYIAPWSQTAFLSLIDRSNCSIESLNFYFTPLTVDDFIMCLQRTQNSLKELTVQALERQAGIMTDKVLDLLTHHEDATHMCLCPNLEVLALYSCLGSTEGHVAQMVKSRLNPAVPLRNTTDSTQVTRIKVIETYDDEKEISWLKPLRSLGLVLKVYSAADGSAIELEPEDAIRLRMLREQGLILRVYTQATGHFGEMD